MDGSSVRVEVEEGGGVEIGRDFEAVGVALDGPEVKAVLQIQLRTYVRVIVTNSVTISLLTTEGAMAVVGLR